ncbi:c2 domain containing protein [Niveomyces insectorum RCEF 264]|uniref:C2 domain containing protein n=1 Tax=Niveomyces insectorum RCEF 264 TaxID=1081102 RepID=A0A167U2T2_9HYPO|nr:c2 domain containing protein [Niveomyces insectorum RCEF 264]
MSTASNRTFRPNRSSLNTSRPGERRPRAASRAAHLAEVSFDNGYSYALRIAYLHYLLQPKKKKKEFVSPPKPMRSHTASSSVGELMKEFMPSSSSSLSSSSSSSSHGMKLPHSFRPALEKRMEGVLRGTEKLPGYNDAAVKRTFGEAYTAFTAESFQRSIDKDRKLEPLILIFYTSASKAQGRGKTADDDNWKPLVDRHLALFVRLISSLLRDAGSDQGRPELMGRLASLEKKLLTNDQDLASDAGQPGEHKMIEVDVPLTYEVKDMPMVQTVARIFGRPLADVQTDIDRDLTVWTEEAALKDLKMYQHRLTSNMPGALRSQDFDLDTAYDEWKKTEIHQITQMMLDLLTARPELTKTSTAAAATTAHAHASGNPLLDRPLPGRPASALYNGDDQAYADLGRMISAHPDPAAAASVIGGQFGYDGSFALPAATRSTAGSDESAGGSTIRTVEEPPDYTYIPPDPRSYYKFVLKHALAHDRQHPDEAVPVSEAVPLQRPTMDLLIELAVHWRLPQVSRAVLLLEVGAQTYMDLALRADELYEVFEDVKDRASFDHLPHNKKPPHIQQFGHPLRDIDRGTWPAHDYTAYQQLLTRLQDAVLRELLETAAQGYEAKPPSIGPSLLLLTDHIHSDRAFPQRPEVLAQFAEALTTTLHDRAAAAYRDFLDTHIPREHDDWDFSHVVSLGRAVVALCERTRKRYRKSPEILGVSPLHALVSTVFPSFEQDAQAIIERVIEAAKGRGLEVNMQDGFDLYKELVDIRRLHVESLPGQPFAFHIEALLEEFVWRWIRGTQERMEAIVEEAIKLDPFQVRGPEHHAGSGPGAAANGQSGRDRDNGGAVPTDDERHSVSIVDMFQAFNQSLAQINQLQWADAVHHAKFMTALAKAFTAGIGRYCELVEQRFAKEMDRLSEQELADVQKSTQDRWIQYARDALTSREKVEPFQFYPESFVKLNNIEYAMQELDKLEKAMDVDGCAETLRRANGPPKPVDRRNAKYVFTIKIVEAEDIKACDPTGTSDPYVVLCDEYQKRLAKTRIIMRTLNPRWDESVEITVSGPLNLIATIWDYDTFGDHDFVGRTSLKLDPIHFGDYLPREFWLDLDTQGRLLLRVSMEGERDDIQFHFGKAFRHLKRTERDMVRKVTDKLTAHISASLSQETLRGLLAGPGLASSMASFWPMKRAVTNTSLGGGSGSSGGSGSGGPGGGALNGHSNSTTKAKPRGPAVTQAKIEESLRPLFVYFDENFAIMNRTLTHATMNAVMTRLWKEVLLAIESLLVPPLSDKPSAQRALTEAELDVVYKWLELLFDFFLVPDEHGVAQGVPAHLLKTPKYHELVSLNFFYFETTENLIRTSERMAAATAQRAQQQQQQQQLQQQQNSSRHLSAPPGFGPGGIPPSAFASMGTIRRGKSIMMSRNLGTMRRAKEAKWRDAQADPSDDMILRILRMRPEAAQYLKERNRQKERMAANQAAALIVRQSISQGWASGPAFGGATYSRTNLPLR